MSRLATPWRAAPKGPIGPRRLGLREGSRVPEPPLSTIHGVDQPSPLMLQGCSGSSPVRLPLGAHMLRGDHGDQAETYTLTPIPSPTVKKPAPERSQVTASPRRSSATGIEQPAPMIASAAL